MPSISPAGHPWKVDSVIWPESRVVKSSSLQRARSSGISARRASTWSRASFMDSIQARTCGERMPARS